MRAWGVSLSLLVAVVAALVALPTGWVGTHLADEENYVDFTAPIATDPETQEAVAEGIAKEIVAEKGLPEATTSTLTSTLTNTAAGVSADPKFREAWAETQRLAHRSILDPAEGESAGVDMAPLAQFLLDAAAESLPIDIEVSESLVVELQEQPDQRWVDLIRASSTIAWLATAAVAVASVLALVLARRRSTALLGLGLGALMVAVVLAVASRVLVPTLLEGGESPSEFEQALQQVLVDRVADSFDGWLVWVALAGAVAATAGFLLRRKDSRLAV
jgi:hypothetical protein